MAQLIELPRRVAEESEAAPFDTVDDFTFDPALTYREVREKFESDFERSYVSWLLGRHNGNISAAAREARMDRKHLYDLARRHGLRGRS